MCVFLQFSDSAYRHTITRRKGHLTITALRIAASSYPDMMMWSDTLYSASFVLATYFTFLSSWYALSFPSSSPFPYISPDNQFRPELDYIWSLIRIDAPLDIPMTPFLLKKEDMPVVPETTKKVITMEKFLSSWWVRLTCSEWLHKDMLRLSVSVCL